MVSARVRITVASFLAYCVMSGMLSPIGIVLPSLAEQLALPLTEAAELFSWLTLGILLGAAIALVVFDVLSLRAVMLAVCAIIALSLLALRVGDSAWVLRGALAAVGSSCGVLLAAAASAISLLYAEDRRASMLVITDGAFSVSGAATSALAVALVGAGLHWASVYLLVAALALAIIVLVATAPFPAAPLPPRDATTARWPLPVWLCIVGLFLYTLGQYSLLWWLPSYLETELGVPRDRAGTVVSRFWTGMLCGQLFVAWWVLRIGARRLVLLSVGATFVFSLPLWLVPAPALLPWLALLWGMGNLGLLKVVIAFASLAVATPTPRLIAALLFGATCGTAVSPTVTSGLAGALGTRGVLAFGSVCYLALALLVLLAHWLTRENRGPRAEGAGSA